MKTKSSSKLLWVLLTFGAVFWLGGFAGVAVDELVHPAAHYGEIAGAYLVGAFGCLFLVSSLAA